MTYTINSIDIMGTINFSFEVNGHTYTCGENFGQMQDITSEDGTITTAGEQLDKTIQSYIQNLTRSVPQTITEMVGIPQTPDATIPLG